MTILELNKAVFKKLKSYLNTYIKVVVKRSTQKSRNPVCEVFQLADVNVAPSAYDFYMSCVLNVSHHVESHPCIQPVIPVHF